MSNLSFATPWHDRRDVVAALYCWLVDHGQLDTSDPQAVARFLRRPWEHEQAFDAMTQAEHERGNRSP